MSSVGRVTNAQLAYWQGAFVATCDTTATVKRNTSIGAPNPDGTTPLTLSTIYTAIPAMLRTPQGGYIQALAEALVDRATWQISLPATINGVATDIRRGDFILIDGLTLTVEHLLFPQSLSINQSVLASMPR